MVSFSLLGLQHPEPNGSRRATPTSTFQHRPGHPLFHYGLKAPIQNRKMLAHQLGTFWDGPIFIFSKLREYFPIDRERLLFVPHHLSHVLSALYYANDQATWASLVVDGVGDGECCVIFDIESPTSISKVWSSKFPHSLGLFYSAITDFLGFFVNDGEYHVMALAAYGKPIFAKEIGRSVLTFSQDTLFLNEEYFCFSSDPEISFNTKLEEIFGESRDIRLPFPRIGTTAFQKWADIAASAQSVFEERLVELAVYSIELTRRDKLLISGGAALNCVAVSRLANECNVEVFVPPSPGDAGAAIGAGYYAVLMNGACLSA